MQIGGNVSDALSRQFILIGEWQHYFVMSFPGTNVRDLLDQDRYMLTCQTRVCAAGGINGKIVESSQPTSSFIRFLNHLYLRLWVFPSGYLISGNKGAYRYLAESARNFYSAEEMQGFLLKAGFKQATAKRLFFGAAAVYTAIK